MKILHVSYVYPPKLGIADGITTVMQNVTKGLSKRGHDVSVYTSNMLDLHGNTSLYPGTSVISNITVYYSKSIWHFKTLFFTPSILLMFSKNLSKYDIIHIHDCRSFQGISAYMFARIKKIPYVYQPHGSYLFSNLDTTFKKMLKFFLDTLISNKIVRDSSKIIALNQIELTELKIFGVPKEKIVIIPNGIDLSSLSELPQKGLFKKKFGIDADSRIILFLGRIHEIKGIDTLIKAFVNIVKSVDKVLLVIVGPDDGFLGKVRTLISTLKMEGSVLLIGPLYGEDKFEAYVDATIVVVPSRYEMFPMVVLESYACSTPVIASRVGGLQEIVSHGKTGLLVKQGAVDELSSALEIILNNNDLRNKLALNAKKYVECKFSINRIIDSLEATYSKILGS